MKDDYLVCQLARFVHDLSFDAVPSDVVKEAKRCILDTVGVIVAGKMSPVSQSTMEYVKNTYRKGAARVLGASFNLHPMGAALANGVAGHAYDFDDTSYTGIMHGSVVVLPAALAIAEEYDVTGARLLEAFIAGVEVEYAIAEFCTDSIYFKGWWTTGVYGTIGAAAASAKILNLSQSETTHAIALATSLTTGMKVSFGSDGKPLGVGMASARGVECALLAKAGLTGPEMAFEDDRGFLKLLNDNQHLSRELELSSRWRLIEPGILFKSFPVCSAAQAGAELTRKLLDRHSIKGGEVKCVICDVPPLVDISLVYNYPESVREAQFSMPFAMGCMLAYGALGLNQLNEKTLFDPVLQEQMQKVTMQVPESLRDDPTVLTRCPEGAGVRLQIENGQEVSDFLDRPTGMPGNPISDQALIEKMIDCFIFAEYRTGDAERFASRLLELDRVTDIRELTSTLI